MGIGLRVKFSRGISLLSQNALFSSQIFKLSQMNFSSPARQKAKNNERFFVHPMTLLTQLHYKSNYAQFNS